MHERWHEPAGMHDAAAAAAAAACMHARACAAACVIDTIYQMFYMSAQTRAWRIEFSYKDIRDYWARLKGRVRGAAPRTRPFNRAQKSPIFLHENSILHARPECTFAFGWPKMHVFKNIYILSY